MNIKESIKALLQTKFGGVQLSDARIEAFAKRFEGKVTSEEDLETRLFALDEALPFADIAKEDDRVRSLEAAAKKKPGEEKKPDTDPAKKPDGDEAPEWAKALIEGNKTLTEKLAALEGNKIVNDRKSAILAKLKDADESYSAKVLRDFGRMSFADDAAFEEYLGEVETDFTTHVQTTAESQLGKDAPFVGMTDAKGHVSDTTVEEIVNNL